MTYSPILVLKTARVMSGYWEFYILNSYPSPASKVSLLVALQQVGPLNIAH